MMGVAPAVFGALGRRRSIPRRSPRRQLRGRRLRSFGRDPRHERRRDPRRSLIAKANAGVPQWHGAHIHYSGTPELMAIYAGLAVDAGARIVGGCCGKTPAHVAAMRRALDAHRPGARPDVEAIVAALGPLVAPPAAEAAPAHAPARAGVNAKAKQRAWTRRAIEPERRRGRQEPPLAPLRPRRPGRWLSRSRRRARASGSTVSSARRRRARRIALSRTRLKALIEAGEVEVDGAGDARSRRRGSPGARESRSTRRRAEESPLLGEDIAARRRLRGRASGRHRQAGRARRPSGAGTCRGHARQRADPPLRREPLGHRRGQAAGHRPSPRQGHVRADRRRQDRRRASGARRAVRRSWPHRLARARISRARLGRASTRAPARSMRRSAAIRASARKWRSSPRRARPSRRHPLARRGAARPGEPRSPADWRPAARIRIRVHLAHIGHPLLGDSVYGAGFKTKAARLGAGAEPRSCAGRQALHAATLGFDHPVTGELLLLRESAAG